MSNVTLNAGSGGATLGTDTVTGTPNVDYQIVKIGFSAAGAAPTQVSITNPLPAGAYFSGTAASVNSGVKDAGTLRVVIATDQPSLTNAQPVIQSGAWTVSVNGVVADATAFTRGTTVQLPVGGVVEAAQAGLTVGQTRALSLTTGALLRVDASGVAVPVTGTFWQTTQPVSAASLPLPTGAAADTSVNGILVAQGSATSGEKGPLVQGAVTTAAPTYTTAQTSPLSLTTAGALRVDNSGVTQPVSGTVTANAGSGTFNIQANASVNVAQVGGSAVVTGTGAGGAGIPRVTVSNDSAVQLTDGTNTPVAVKAASTAAVATDKALVVAVSPNNTVGATQSGTWTVQPGNTANTTPWLVTDVPGTSPGSTRSRVKAAATSTNSTNLKGSAGVVLGYSLYNNTASAKFFKFYDKATAPTVGTDTPAFTVIIPASGGANVEFSTGIPFSTGIGYGITGAVADADTTNTAADDVHGMVLWK